MLYHSNQIMMIGDFVLFFFSVVYKDSNLCNYGDPTYNDERNLRT